MVPRSLALAVAIGAASGAAAALALADVRAGPQGPFELQVLSERYEPGSPVLVRLTNSGGEQLPAGRLEVSGLAGMPVYGEDIGGLLGPGESADLVWDQRGSDGEPAFAGIYRIKAGEPPASATVEISAAGLRGD